MTELKALARVIWRHRLSSSAAMAMLAISVGGATTTFALIDAVLWRALPYRDADRVAVLMTTHAAGQANVSLPDFTAIRDRAEHVDVAAAGGFTPEYALTGHGEPRQLRGRVLTGDYFHTLGVPLAAGRDFTRDEERPGAGTVAIITDALRAQLFGTGPAVGETLSLNGRPYTVVGVLPPYRDPFGSVEIYVPQQFAPTLPRRFRMLSPIVRLGPNSDLEQLRSLIRVATASSDPEAAGYTVAAMTLGDHVAATTRRSAQLLFGAATGLLVIGLINFAMLLGARAYDRQIEFSIRAALGATRKHILVLTVMDATVLSVAGVVAALIATQLLLPFVQAQYGGDIVNAVGVNWRVVSFASVIAAMAILTAVFATRRPLSRPLAVERQTIRSRLTSGRALVVAQIAVSMALVLGAAALVRGFIALRHVDPGFRTVDILAGRIALPAGRYSTGANRAQFWRTLLDKLDARDVKAAITTELPLSGEDNPTSFTARLSDGHAIATKIRSISPRYFDVMHIPLIEGRGLAATDTAATPLVVVVNQRLASALSRVGPPIGQTISFDVSTTPLIARVVGIVGDIRHEGLHREPAPEAYAAFEQTPLATYSLVMPLEGSLADASRLLRASVAEVDRGQPLTGPVLMSQYVERSLAGSRFQTGVLSFFAWTALVAAATGLYGFLAYLVRGSRREWAVRLALGATPGALRRYVFGRTGLYVACGIGAGVILTAMVGRALQGIAPGVVIWNPIVLTTSVAVLAVACLAAATIPAWRAGRISPLEILRDGNLGN
jgi:putative ABC transport system permease protein